MRRRIFPCGHTGKGRYCHTCERLEKQLAEKQQKRQEWRERCDSYDVVLDCLPVPIAKKAMHVMTKMDEGEPYRSVQGKQLHNLGCRLVSVPIGRSYRLVCRYSKMGVRPIEVLSHGEYTSRISRGGW